MRRALFILTGLAVTGMAVATHCPDDPDCGHGGECDPQTVCAILKGISPGEDTICVGGTSGVSGGGGGPNPTPPAGFPPEEQMVEALIGAGGAYSYDDASHGCVGTANNVDPISLIAHMDLEHLNQFPTGVNAYVPDHFNHHGDDWNDLNFSTGQYFFDFWAGCVEGEWEHATGHFTMPRYHVRAHKLTGLFGIHPAFGGWGQWELTYMTPHYDSLAGCGHYVAEDWNGIPGYSGFEAARDYIVDLWLSGPMADHHTTVIATLNFENVDAMTQRCTGQEPQSDGRVFNLGLCFSGTYPCGPQ